MRKLFILLVLLGCGVGLKAQIPGSKIKGPITVLNHQFAEGDTLKIGTGTNPNGDFKFVYVPQNALLGTEQYSLGKMYANTRVAVKHFKLYEHRKIGKKTFTVVNFGGLNAVVELEQAINSGEVMVEGLGPKPEVLSNADFVSEEIIKLKKLLDAGAITEAEFTAAKKKILGI